MKAESLLTKWEKVCRGISPYGRVGPADAVAQAIDTEMKKGGYDHVYLDISHKSEGFIKEHFPNAYEGCLRFGFDLSSQPIPIVPAAHYLCVA